MKIALCICAVVTAGEWALHCIKATKCRFSREELVSVDRSNLLQYRCRCGCGSGSESGSGNISGSVSGSSSGSRDVVVGVVALVLGRKMWHLEKQKRVLQRETVAQKF